MKIKIIPYLILITFLYGCNSSDISLITQSLTNNWFLVQCSTSDTFPGTVPGNVHFDLLQAGKIPDPFYRDNEVKVQWIEKEDWAYMTTFHVNQDILNNENVNLIFEGIDTYAKIYLNDSLIFTSDNMFRLWKNNVKGILQKGKNNLLVYLESPVNKMIPLRDSLPFVLPTVNDKTEKTCPLSRKAPYHFGWDWGPRIVTSGIWRPVYIESWNTAKINNVYIAQDHTSKEEILVEFNIEAEATKKIRCEVEIQLELQDIKRSALIKKELSKGKNKLQGTIQVENPKLWYPSGYGDQPLYNVNIKLKKGNHVLSEDHQKIGLRKVELIQEKDSIGRSFYFKVNDIPVFAKGANAIPFDNLLNRVTETQYRRVLEDAIAANMNMIRVWGGGIYENDVFYNVCDELGLLVWQDFIFGNNMYNVDQQFYNSVKQEAIYNVKRLRNHPCIVIWCGDNEGEWMWKRGWNKTHDQTLWEGYKSITYNLLDSIVKIYDPQRPYWRSSPTSNSDTIPPNHPSYGNVHDWRIHFGRPPYENYFNWKHRFVSEFGHQSFADWNTIIKYTAPEDRLTEFETENYGRKMKADVLDLHNKQPWGNQKIKLYMEYYYNVPKDFKQYTYLSQICHAEGIKTGVEYFRRSKPVCMGALYWQLNDCWPATSWSGIDYYGRWKALHYYVKRFYQNILISPVINNDRLEVHVVSDSTSDISVKMELSLFDFEGNELNSINKKATISALESKMHYSCKIDEILRGNDPRQVFLYCELKMDEKVLSTNPLFFDLPKNIEFPAPKIERKIQKIENGFEIKLLSDKLARNVGLIYEKEDGFFSDNYFDLLPGRVKTITWESDKMVDKEEFIHTLELLMINDL